MIDRVAQLEEDLAKIMYSQDPVSEFIGVPIHELVDKDGLAYEDLADRFMTSSKAKEDIQANISKKSFYGLASIQERYHAKEALKDFYSFNDGYAFVTFSHSDEARIALMFS